MFLKRFQRCIASLLIVAIGSGLTMPTTVFAGLTDNYKGKGLGDTVNVTNNLVAESYNEYAYTASTSAYTDNKSSPDNGTTKRLIRMKIGEGSYEKIGWSVDKSFINNDWRTLDEDIANSFTNKVLTKIDKSLGMNIGNEDDLFDALFDLGNSQGASSTSLTNLNQRMAMFLYVRLNPTYFLTDTTATAKIKFNDISSISSSSYNEFLNSTLNSGHDKSLRNKFVKAGLLVKEEDINESDVHTLGKSKCDDIIYSINNLGIIAINTVPSNISYSTELSNRLYALNNPVFIANEMAIYICLSEYVDWYLTEMPRIAKSSNWKSDDSVASTLAYLRVFNESFGEMIPIVNKLYNLKNSDADNLSIKDMVEQCNADSMGVGDALTVDTSDYVEHEDDTSPITRYYTIKPTIGITSYDRDKILSDIEVDTSHDEETEEEHEKREYQDATNGENNYEISNTFLATQSQVAQQLVDLYTKAEDATNKNDSNTYDECMGEFFEIVDSGAGKTIFNVLRNYYGEPWSSNVTQALNNNNPSELILHLTEPVIAKIKSIADGYTTDIEEYLTNRADRQNVEIDEITDNLIDYGVDANGRASSYGSVTINTFITEGLGYSTSYVPMRTNLYSPDVLAKFSDDKDAKSFYNSYVDYGFMRKALYKDNSSSAAMDYYNAGGESTGDLTICTLRDMINVGNKDLVLYIDPAFYNSDIAIEEGNSLLKNNLRVRENIYNSLNEFAPIWENANFFTNNAKVALDSFVSGSVASAIVSFIDVDSDKETYKVNMDDVLDAYKKEMKKSYEFNVNRFETAADMKEFATNQSYANSQSSDRVFTEQTLKTGDYTSYDNLTRSLLSEIEESDYVDLSDDKSEETNIRTDDNLDSIVLPSSYILQYLSGETVFKQTIVDEKSKTETVHSYTTDSGYSPLMSLAYVSCLYRSANTYTLANTVLSNNPVFIASDDLCGIKEANQWYRNSLLNYVLLRNLKGNAQVGISYVTDLDCPVYMDIFGNILTESGVVIIPAACNATLHTGSFKDYNYGIGLYSCYGKEYTVPSDLKGAQSVLYPYFVIDENVGEYVISGITMNVNNSAVRFDKIDTYDDKTHKAVKDAYLSSISSGDYTRLNWMAIVHIVNEVMRGAPIESINKDETNLIINHNKSGLLAAAKLEAMLESLHGQTSNTLLCIPDFSRMENMEVWVALLIKLVMVATAAVIIISIYRDGVSGQLGLRTFLNSLIAIALTVSCIVVIPSVFQLTYYSANKFLLEEESMRILMVNEEKRQGGSEIGITKVNTVESTGEFALQLDWVTVPWYEELETILYDSTLDNLQETKLKAYRESAIYNNTDITMYNDGAYVTTDNLFDSVNIDFTFNRSGPSRGLYLTQNNNQQTASYYSPYYVFLRTITANVNEYNRWLNSSGDNYLSEDAANSAVEAGQLPILGSYNYTTKYMSGNRLKTVGLCKAYFESQQFMEYDEDLLRLNQIYGDALDESNPAIKAVGTREASFDRAMLYSSDERKQFRASYWYNDNVVDCNMDYYNNVGKTDVYSVAEKRNMYVQEELTDYYAKVEAMDKYARDFIAQNKDMLSKVTDETFIKVMALSMSIKYNQLFGVPSANALEIFNMNSEDLIRLCIIPTDEAVMATAMSYPRFVYTFGGEAGVYMASILAVIMWLGSFIKPLSTIIVFISVFLSIFVFRVVLRKPSANLWGYFVTVSLLCGTNILHALILKLGVNLPNFGLSSLGCLIFLIVGQVVYLLILAYVTGVSLKDWSNLGASEYEKEANLIKSKFRQEDTSAKLSGRIKHHDDNWDYYNDLVKQHRGRNIT